MSVKRKRRRATSERPTRCGPEASPMSSQVSGTTSTPRRKRSSRLRAPDRWPKPPAQRPIADQNDVSINLIATEKPATEESPRCSTREKRLSAKQRKQSRRARSTQRKARPQRQCRTPRRAVAWYDSDGMGLIIASAGVVSSVATSNLLVDLPTSSIAIVVFSIACGVFQGQAGQKWRDRKRPWFRRALALYVAGASLIPLPIPRR